MQPFWGERERDNFFASFLPNIFFHLLLHLLPPLHDQLPQSRSWTLSTSLHQTVVYSFNNIVCLIVYNKKIDQINNVIEKKKDGLIHWIHDAEENDAEKMKMMMKRNSCLWFVEEDCWCFFANKNQKTLFTCSTIIQLILLLFKRDINAQFDVFFWLKNSTQFIISFFLIIDLVAIN